MPADTANRTKLAMALHNTGYLPREAFDRLREIAFTKRCKVHDLIMQGVDRVIAEHGHGEKASRS